VTAPLVHVSDEAGGTWRRLRLDGPPGHILSLAMVQALTAAVDEAGRRPGLKWLTIEGSRGQFSYGASIPEHLPARMREVLPAMHGLMRRVLDVPVPTAALVDGRCLGGGFELALCCDAIVATTTATLGLPEIKLAAFPPVAAALLPIRVGATRASRAVITGDALPASYWHQAGLVSVVPETATLYEAAFSWFARYLAPRAAVALSHAALAARTVWRPQIERALAENERRYLDELLTSPDAEEGVRAWMEKRQPRWQE
jgi:cyclohexa-1,5-dienecarbonyl-CoA hydratase